MTATAPSDSEVRALRDRVFGHRISDQSWAMIRHNWITPENVAWLREKAARSLDHYAPQYVTQ